MRELAIELAEPGGERLAPGRGERRGHARGEPLEVSHDEVHLLAVVAGERCDDEAPLASFAGRGDEALLLETVEGAAHRCATQPETFGDDALGDARAGRELAPDDDAAQVVIGARDVVEALVGTGGGVRGAAAGGSFGRAGWGWGHDRGGYPRAGRARKRGGERRAGSAPRRRARNRPTDGEPLW